MPDYVLSARAEVSRPTFPRGSDSLGPLRVSGGEPIRMRSLVS